MLYTDEYRPCHGLIALPISMVKTVESSFCITAAVLKIASWWKLDGAEVYLAFGVEMRMTGVSTLVELGKVELGSSSSCTKGLAERIIPQGWLGLDGVEVANRCLKAPHV